MAIILFYGQAAVSCHNQSPACVSHPFFIFYFFIFGIEGKRPYLFYFFFYRKRILIRSDGDVFKYISICTYICIELWALQFTLDDLTHFLN
jgi:hypothetical protein